MAFLLMACDPKIHTVDFTNNTGYQLVGMFNIGANQDNIARVVFNEGDSHFVVAESLGSFESAFNATFPDGKMQFKLYKNDVLECYAEYHDELNKYLLQEYEIYYDELEKLGRHLYYPPTPEMKDIKMWPPYEEAIKNTESVNP